MQEYVHRLIENRVKKYLGIFPSIALLGSRQCGKSTLIKVLCNKLENFVYLDLQNYADLAKLNDPILFFEANRGKTVCLDEIQRQPTIFEHLRSEIDANRENGRFILLGSASRDLIQHSSESLAGRIGILNLTPFLINELFAFVEYQLNSYWLRGGYPEAYLAVSDENAAIWLESYIQTYIERDIPQLGYQIPANNMRRLLTLLAHQQGQLLNASKLGEILNVSHNTIRNYIDLFEQTFIVRRLMPYERNVKKRIVKSPRIYIRDTGILHVLLQIKDFNALLSNPVFGQSWEGMAIENICSVFDKYHFSFYRSSTGDEIDLIMDTGEKIIAMEFKASKTPKPTKNFWKALETIKPDETYIIAPVDSEYSLTQKVKVCNINEICSMDF